MDFFNEARLRRMNNESWLRPVKRAFGNGEENTRTASGIGNAKPYKSPEASVKWRIFRGFIYLRKLTAYRSSRK